MKGIIVIVASAMILVGCATAPTLEKIAAADYGSPISTEEAAQLASSYMKARAKDPYSLRVECGDVTKGWTQNKFSSRSFFAGYLIECSVNGKNSFGAYVGARNYQFAIHNGSVVRVLEQMENGGFGPPSIVDAMRN